MPDFALCDGEGCPLEQRRVCQRHMSFPSPHRQSYIKAPVKPDGTCGMLARDPAWANRSRELARSLAQCVKQDPEAWEVRGNEEV